MTIVQIPRQGFFLKTRVFKNVNKTNLQEYYWIDEDISVTEPTYYNVVYFEGRGDEVSYFDKSWKKLNIL